MMLPRGDEYNVAIQNPKISFNDLELKSSQVEQTPLGLPKPYSGGFTITYKLFNYQRSWAVRCFHRDISDLQKRYRAVEAFLSRNRTLYFVEAKYLPDGIKVNGLGYPIIKMVWLEGEPLNIYLNKTHSQKIKVLKLLADFENLIGELERFGIAHGDLQHGNIIVKNEKLYLIDYDGMYFPELASLKSNEIGHINYQHPGRSASDYNQYIDRFSAIVIYVGLKAISINPNLWKKYDNSENILFKSQDFGDLKHSPLIKELSLIPELVPLIDRLIGCCHLPFDKTPSLNNFLAGNFSYNKGAVGTINITRNQYEILAATNKKVLFENFGSKVEVVGKISDKYVGASYNGSPYIFLNFGFFPNQTLTIVLWAEAINALTERKLPPALLVGKWVSVTGVLASYRNSPQMIIDLPSQIQVLLNEAEAIQRLKPNSISGLVAPKTIDKEADVFNGLYKNRPTYTPPKSISVTKSAPIVSSRTHYTPSAYNKSIQPTSPLPNKKKNSLTVIILFAIIGGLIVGAASDGKLVLLGLIGGGLFGNWIQKFF